jgi:hypothetical protein
MATAVGDSPEVDFDSIARGDAIVAAHICPDVEAEPSVELKRGGDVMDRKDGRDAVEHAKRASVAMPALDGYAGPAPRTTSGHRARALLRFRFRV